MYVNMLYIYVLFMFMCMYACMQCKCVRVYATYAPCVTISWLPGCVTVPMPWASNAINSGPEGFKPCARENRLD